MTTTFHAGSQTFQSLEAAMAYAFEHGLPDVEERTTTVHTFGGRKEHEPVAQREQVTQPIEPITAQSIRKLCKRGVTRGKWAKFCKATGREDRSLRQQDPARCYVVGITFEEAMAYASWLSDETGTLYDLPTEKDLVQAEGKETYDKVDWDQWPLSRPEQGRVQGSHVDDLVGVCYWWTKDKESGGNVIRGGSIDQAEWAVRLPRKSRCHYSLGSSRIGFRLVEVTPA